MKKNIASIVQRGSGPNAGQIQSNITVTCKLNNIKKLSSLSSFFFFSPGRGDT